MDNKTYDNLYLEKLQSIFGKTKEYSYEQLNPKLDDTIVDIGCGVGQDAINLAKSGCKVIGIDHDQNFIEIAKKHINPNLKIEFICSSANNIPLKTNSVDKIRFDRVFQHIEDYEPVFNEIKRILKCNGQLQIIETDYLSLSLFMENIMLERKILDLLSIAKKPYRLNIRKLSKILPANKFEIDSLTIHNHIIRTTSIEENLIFRFDKIVKEAFQNKYITISELEEWELHRQKGLYLSINLLIYNALKLC